MEADRFNQNHALFIICMICMVLSLSLFALGFYILPFLVWGWHYGVPGFVMQWTEWLKENYSYSQAGANALVFLIFIVPALITGFISYVTSNVIENQVLGITHEKPSQDELETHELKESLGFGIKLLILIVIIVVAVLFLEWLIAVPAPETEY